jgi:hypothetical protein
LSRTERFAFSETGLREIIIPASVRELGEMWFYECTSLSSITFEAGSKLQKGGQNAFLGVPIHPTLATKECSLWWRNS